MNVNNVPGSTYRPDWCGSTGTWYDASNSMYGRVSKANHAAWHRTAHHRTISYSTAGHGTARRCAAELALRDAAELSCGEPN